MNRRVNILLVIILSFFMGEGMAQYSSSFSHFSENQTYYNPAANGYREAMIANFFYRQRFVGMPGSPSIQVVSVHAPMKNPKVGAGLLVEHQAEGSNAYTSLHVSYVYRLEVGSNKLTFGLRAGIMNGAQGALDYPDRDEIYDPVLEEENMRFWVPNFGFGIGWYGRNYWAGLSIPRFFGMESKESGAYTLHFDLTKRDYIAMAGGRFSFTPDFGLEPSILLLYNPSKIIPKLTANIMATYKDRYKAGIGYRLGDAVILLLSFDVNRQFSLGYSYDLTFSDLSNHSSGSHEVNIHYKFGYQINASNPRGF